MSEAKKVIELIHNKSKNVITERKAEEILKTIKSQIPSGSFDEKLAQISRYSELPSWLKDALTINETFFFRHPDQFLFLEEHLRKIKERSQNIRILCAGVSTGEEAYSLGFVASKIFGSNFDIVGIDLSPNAIEVAIKGVYHKSLISRAPTEFMEILNSHMKPLSGKDKDYFQVSDEIKSHIRFKAANIFNIPLEDYDIIFLRNILIYFEDQDKTTLFERLYRHTKRDGLFFIGAGELFPISIQDDLKAYKTSVIKKAA